MRTRDPIKQGKAQLAAQCSLQAKRQADYESRLPHDWTKEEFSKQGILLSCFENRQCRQRLVKRRTGEVRTVWAAIRRRCQFKRYNRQREQQKVTRSTAPVVPRGLRKASVVNFTIRIGNADSSWSQAAWRSHALRDAIRRRCQFSANTPKRKLVSHKRH